MPMIRSIQFAPDYSSVTIDRGFKDEPPIVINLVDLHLTGTIAQRENQFNTWLANRFSDGGDQFRIHIYSLSPFKFNIIVANLGVVIPDNWWGE